MKWIGDRISFVDHSNKTTIIILPHKKGLTISLMGAWLAMWYTVGITTFWTLLTFTFNQNEKIVLFVFMSFWVYYAVKVTRGFIWMLWGLEKIKIDEIGIHIKRSIRNFGRKNEYYFENIKNIEFEIPKSNSFQAVWEASPWVNGAERFHFDYFGKVIKFGNKLTEKECQLLGQIVEKRIKKYSKK